MPMTLSAGPTSAAVPAPDLAPAGDGNRALALSMSCVRRSCWCAALGALAEDVVGRVV
jgi:hypothetical protein